MELDVGLAGDYVETFVNCNTYIRFGYGWERPFQCSKVGT
jgi:hypothetical protein